MNKKSKGCLISLTVLTLAAGVMMIFLHRIWQGVTGYEAAINAQMPHLDWLPPEANNVTYYTDWVNQSAEFTIPKETFIDWCKAQGKYLQELTVNDTNSYVWLPRSTLERIGMLEPQDPDQDAELWMNENRKEFNLGDLYFSEVFRNNGGYWIGYDVDEGRAYYFYAHH